MPDEPAAEGRFRRVLKPLAVGAAVVVGGALVALPLIGLRSVTAFEPGGRVVSQKGRAFHPESLTVARGDRVTVVNDDSDLLHHLYIDAAAFKFDSGDQAPGSRTPIVFSEKGTFHVLCGIHPKMKLIVRVN